MPNIVQNGIFYEWKISWELDDEEKEEKERKKKQKITDGLKSRTAQVQTVVAGKGWKTKKRKPPTSEGIQYCINVAQNRKFKDDMAWWAKKERVQVVRLLPLCSLVLAY